MHTPESLQERFSFLRDENVPCGFDLPKGWANIVYSLCMVLEYVGFRDGNVAQVKEKFGGLRFYIDRQSNFSENAMFLIDGAIRMVEDASFRTCQACGALTAGRTLCDPCRDTEGTI